jgi:general stress protein 26
MREAKQPTAELAQLSALIGKLKLGMLTTIDESGSLRSRPLATLEMDAQPALWFLISNSSPKIHDIERSSKVCVSYGNAAADFVSVSGRASLSSDPSTLARLWTPFAKLWFPNGLTDPKLIALKVTIEGAEYWDGPNGKLTQLFAMAKALATGNTQSFGKNGHIHV